jgi:hypothetical protein
MTTSVTLRGVKGSALTYQEVDQNFVNLATAVDAINTGSFATTATLVNYATTASLALYVTTATTQTVTGAKSFTGNTNLRGVQETVYDWGTVSAGTYTIAATSGTIHRMTLGGNVTISAFTAAQTGQSVTLILAQDATGNRTLTSSWLFAGASKTLSTASNAIDVINVFYDGTNYLAGLVKGYA